MFHDYAKPGQVTITVLEEMMSSAAQANKNVPEGKIIFVAYPFQGPPHDEIDYRQAQCRGRIK